MPSPNTFAGRRSYSPEDMAMIRLGYVTGYELVSQRSVNHAVPDSWTVISGAALYPMPAALTSLEALSDSANDTAAGSGIRAVTAYGIGPNWIRQDETVALNGTGVVPFTKAWWRVDKFEAATCGTYSTAGATPSHNSTITLRVAGVGATWAVIDTHGGYGIGDAAIGWYTVPTGKRAYYIGH